MRRHARVDGQRWAQMLLMEPKAKPAGRGPTAGVKWSNMLRSFRKRPEGLKALERVKQWTRARFKLAQDAPILVGEIACGLPGCPPLETVVAFWTDGDTRHHFQGVQARRRGRAGRPSSRLAEERADSGRRRRAGVLLSGRLSRICSGTRRIGRAQLAEAGPNAYAEPSWNSFGIAERWLGRAPPAR